MSVIRVSEGPEADIEDIRSKLEIDRDSLDYLGVASDTDPLDFPDLYRLIKDVRPKGLKVLIITDGRDPANLDDLVGAGYAHAADLLIGREMTEDQRRCISILKDNGCRFAVTVNARDHDEGSLRAVAGGCGGCSMFILRQDRAKPLNRNEMSPLISAAKSCTWNVKTIT
jgi:hypothetical protein